jgi:phospholipid/cholesterol/gamma-HCH transport system substrate-binding protein
MTTKMTQEGAESFMENMEALKHNWLFKSYFEQRGYWDKADYEKELDKKILEIKEQNEALEERIKKLQQLNRQIKANG